MAEQKGRNLLASEVPTPSGRNLLAEPEKTEAPEDRTFDVGQIPESAAFSAVAGALSPEILKYGGRAASMFPATRPLGTIMEVAGEAMKGRRGMAAVGGGLSGGAGETVGQTLKVMGAPKPVQIGGQIATEALGPSLLTSLGKGLPITRQFLKDVEEGGLREAGSRYLERMRGGAPATTREPAEAVIARLEKEATDIRTAGQTRANEIMAAAEARIAALDPGNKAAAEALRRQARDEAAATLFAANQKVMQQTEALRKVKQQQRFGPQLRVGEGTRMLVGQPKEAGEVGDALRQKVVEQQGERLAARKAQVKADQDAVVTEVSTKQAKGDLIQNTKEYQDILVNLRKKLGIGEEGKAFPLESETDPGVRASLQKVYDALDPTKRDYVSEQGIAMPGQIGFDAVDTVRRRLGEAFKNEMSDYGAIGQGYARDLYKQLSNVMGTYSPAKKNLISNYENLSRELDVFGTKRAKKATAVERFDDTRFQTDAASLPSEYFRTKESVNDLIELTGGDRKFVEQQAASYVARQLEGVKTPDAAATFERNNREWLTEFPGLQASVNRYMDSLGFAETRGRRLTEAAKALKTSIGELPTTAQREAKRITTEAEAQAKGIEGRVAGPRAEAARAGRTAQAEANARARLLSSIGGQDPVKAFDALVERGNTARLREAAPVIKSDPQIADQFVEGVKITLSRVDPAMLADKYNRLVQPALLDTGLITPAQAKELARQVQLVELTVNPDRKLMEIGRIIKNAVVGEAGARGSRLTESLGLDLSGSVMGVR